MISGLMILIISTSFAFIMMIHPMSMGFALLFQTLMISMLSGVINNSFWFSYILFLIMIGGMLVLFIYMTSIASNEKFMFSMKISLISMASMILMLTFNPFEMFTFNLDSNFYTNLSLCLNKFYIYPANIILFTMVIYLFITLIASVKIINIKQGPLRQKI